MKRWNIILLSGFIILFTGFIVINPFQKKEEVVEQKDVVDIVKDRMATDTNNAHETLKVKESLEEESKPIRGLGLPAQAATISLEQIIGADMIEIDFASDELLIFHGYMGLFVYDLQKEEIRYSVNLKVINCGFTQGSEYCEVIANEDGSILQLHNVSKEYMYEYITTSNLLVKMPYEPMDKTFVKDITSNQLIDEGYILSYDCVGFDNGEWGYLRTADWALGTLQYVRGNKIINLFELDNNCVIIAQNEVHYTPAMSSVRGLGLSPNIILKEEDEKYYNYRWITEEGEFLWFGKEVINRGEDVFWNPVAEDEVINIDHDFNIRLDVLEEDSNRVISTSTITIMIEENGFYCIGNKQ